MIPRTEMSWPRFPHGTHSSRRCASFRHRSPPPAIPQPRPLTPRAAMAAPRSKRDPTVSSARSISGVRCLRLLHVGGPSRSVPRLEDTENSSQSSIGRSTAVETCRMGWWASGMLDDLSHRSPRTISHRPTEPRLRPVVHRAGLASLHRLSRQRRRRAYHCRSVPAVEDGV